ncbi:Cyt-b5 [Symbiodinium natans]|uniref:Cyt-b5 protein n=1 Tax=Symbiodinium natans TaxID=878477 RepID=A0A812TRH7_9DINO|nr:Cyt-b5 [Symbiodinium natans]
MEQLGTLAPIDDGGLGMLQHAAVTARAKPIVAPSNSLSCKETLGAPINQTGGEHVRCDLTAAAFCLNWHLVVGWWIPIGHDFGGCWPLACILALLLVGRWNMQELPPPVPPIKGNKRLYPALRPVHFWCDDLPPHRYPYLAMAAAAMWLPALADYPIYDNQSVPMLPRVISFLPWWVAFMPAALCMLAMGRCSPTHRIGSAWHWASICAMIPATAAFVLTESTYTTHHRHGYRFLPASYAFVGVSLTLLALLAGCEARISSWLRKYCMLVCSGMYIAGGISKLLNNKPFLRWADGTILQYWTLCFESHSGEIPYPWFSRMLANSTAVSSLFSWATMCFELPLSIAALVGLGCFGHRAGGLGLVRVLWCIVACGFHCAVNLLWGPISASMYDIQAWLLLLLVADVCSVTSVFRAERPQETTLKTQEAQEAQERDHESLKQEAWGAQIFPILLSLLCTLLLFGWVAVALAYHFPSDDPQWPICSVPMYSMSCGVRSCPDEFRNEVWDLPLYQRLFLSLAAASMTMLRQP